MPDPFGGARPGGMPPPPPPPPVPPAPARPTRATWTGGDIGLSLLVGLVASIVLGFAVVLGARALDLSPGLYATVGVVGVLVYACFFGAAYLFIVGIRKASPASVGLRSVGAGPLLLMIPVAFAVMLVNALVVLLLRVVLGDGVPTAEQQLGASARMDLGDFIWLFLLAAVAAPIAEEFLFRGVLYRWFRKRFGFGGAAALASSVFAVAHFTPALMVPYLLFGMVLSFFTERYDSLYPPMLLHALNNGAVVVLVYFALTASG